VSDNFFSNFYELGYTHAELETLLEKMSRGEVLTKEQYDSLIAAVNIVTSLTTFDGSYESLKDKPDIVDIIKQSNEFITYSAFDTRAKTIYVSLEQQFKKLIGDVQLEMNEAKADRDHSHDNRYSLINHMHEGLYVTQEERSKDLQNLVTKDYLDSVIATLGPGSGGGGIYPTYIKPKLIVNSNVSPIPHKETTTVIITPTYTQNDAGALIKFSIRRNDETVYEGTEIKSFSEDVYLKHDEYITYTFAVEYEDGIIKDTVNGDPYPDTMIKAGSIVSGITIKGCANSYYGTIEDKNFDISDIVNLTPIRNISKEYICTYNMDNQKSVYMYPESFGQLKSIKDSNGFEYKNSYTLNTINYDDVIYNVYVLTDAVTVDGEFEQTFS
jgi:hypothetical protein